MIPAIITALVPALGTLVDRLIPDKAAAQRAKDDMEAALVKAANVAALEDVLAENPVSIMIIAEYADRVRVASVPIDSPALMRGLHVTVERMLWPDTDEGEES